MGENMTLRDRVIYILESRKGEYISGQDIADTCKVSRSAIAKCVAALKAEGYPISSVNNLGHSLDKESDILSESGIRAVLGDENIEIKVYKTIDSTSSEAKRAIGNLSGNAIFAAEEQTAGRGRHGKSFYSPKQSGLYFSCVLHPEVKLSDAPAITSACAVAVCEAIELATKKHPQIKWVNDIFIDDRKVCGILTEAVSDFETQTVQAVIVGIGINLTTEDFPQELAEIATSLGTKTDRCKLIADVYSRLNALCDALPDKSFMREYRARSLVLGRDIRFTRNSIDYTAKAVAIHDDGGLEVLTESGETIVLNSGEISIRL